jgi:hypothetical protein
MPVNVTLPDPWTGEPFTVRRENYLAILTVDSHNLLFEGQPLAAFMAEAGRASRAATYQAELAEIRYRKWRSQRATECRQQKSEKKPSEKAVEEYYRSHKDYEEMASQSKRFEALSGLFSDLRDAFREKSRIQHDQTYLTGAYESVERADENFDRLQEIETLEEEAEKVMDASGSAKAAAAAAQDMQPPPDPPNTRQPREL